MVKYMDDQTYNSIVSFSEVGCYMDELSVVGDFMYADNPVLFAEAVSESIWYSKDRSNFNKPMQLPDTPWFCCGGGYDGKHFRNVAARLTEKMGCLENIQLEILNPIDSE